MQKVSGCALESQFNFLTFKKKGKKNIHLNGTYLVLKHSNYFLIHLAI